MRNHKYICFILAIFLMFSNIGLAVNIHYCKGEIEQISLGYQSGVACEVDADHDKACCKEKPEKESCCKDDVIKQGTDQNQVVSKVFQVQTDLFVAPITYDFTTPFLLESNVPKSTFVSFYCESNAPPLYKLFKKYIYYA